jgi:hypothetical protein
MALGSTQPLPAMSTRTLPGGGGKGRPKRKADNLTAICEPNVYKMWEPRRLTTLWALTACYRDSFTFIYLLPIVIILSSTEGRHSLLLDLYKLFEWDFSGFPPSYRNITFIFNFSGFPPSYRKIIFIFSFSYRHLMTSV